MRIAIVGAGAIGGYLAARLILSGQPVTVIARGANLGAIRASGITLRMPDGTEETARPELATDNAAEAGPHDVVIVAVKGQQLAALAPSLGPAAGTGDRGRPRAERHPLVVLPEVRRAVRGKTAGVGRPGRGDLGAHRPGAGDRVRDLPGGRAGRPGRGALHRGKPVHRGGAGRRRRPSGCRRWPPPHPGGAEMPRPGVTSGPRSGSSCWGT